MKLRWYVLLFSWLSLLAFSPAEAQAQGGYVAQGYGYSDSGGYYDSQADGQQGTYEDYSAFYDALSPYGDWFYVPAYGYVWYPYVNHATWRPYADGGYWVWSDYGWTWVSTYEWGWAPFHYGRWVWLDGGYWVWVPDQVWGPAWVAWRYTDSYAGWCPLPPGAYWYPNYGLEITVHIPVTCWVFVPGYRLVDVDVYRYAIPRQRTSRVYYASRPSTVYRVQGGAPVSVGVDVHLVRRWIGAPIPQVSVSISSSPSYYRGVQRNTVSFYQPPRRTSRTVSSAPPAPRGSAPASLQRMTAPPPPTRAGVAPSQNYRVQSSVYQRSTSTPPGAAPSSRPGSDLQRATDRQQQEHRELQNERQDLQQERQELRETQRTEPRGSTEVREQKQDVREQRKEVQQQRRETGKADKAAREERRESARDAARTSRSTGR